MGELTNPWSDMDESGPQWDILAEFFDAGALGNADVSFVS